MLLISCIKLLSLSLIRRLFTPESYELIVKNKFLSYRAGSKMLNGMLKKVFGSKGDRDIKRMLPIVEKVNSFEEAMKELPDEGFKGLTDELRESIANGTANIPTPLVQGDYVFCSSGYGTGPALLKLVPNGNGVDAEEVYFLNSRTMQNHHGGMILVGDHIYCGHGHNQGFPLSIEMSTGKVAWKPGRGPGTGSASVTYAEGHLYFRYENGVMALIEANPRRYNLKGKFQLASVNGPSWPHPVISNARLYLRDQDVLLCYDVRRTYRSTLSSQPFFLTADWLTADRC